ncbi:hypothetical protein STMUK_p101 (plasmid) [Salmonella enterica subsp. enterica serovar Typhimurium str. UK-1]|uniref:Uncharacterized protein n=5 Tax=Salmonella typhimurium TaxID=90371 RepID=Q93GR8_SALTY|nr:hypothetical protein [Salmonella enterica]NP_490514.1 hypothetical protein PSLT024 [Salmonella enterica subsp. enterica serovar Typhimurium str. LT2]ACY86457.1 hypothetical protein STM14_5547 [Salmonella enterica subsp. enterica serovar Typhimurium str. 14028S]ADX20467.1 replication protein [Salmonella enterica subsp. enterica serovar Typhimurium str. ST4/74]AEF10482.1 hypothetical protein STMUK_p101 [Salmonella enterica subsp. enterica serovar Typhimurium str. UK-1]AOZ60991.1 hypothetical 
MKSLSISRRGPVISTLSNPSALARDRRVSSSDASVRESVFFLRFFSDLSVGTNTPSRIRATGCTVLLALGVRFTISPEDLSTSTNNFFMSRLSLSRAPPIGG